MDQVQGLGGETTLETKNVTPSHGVTKETLDMCDSGGQVVLKGSP